MALKTYYKKYQALPLLQKRLWHFIGLRQLGFVALAVLLIALPLSYFINRPKLASAAAPWAPGANFWLSRKQITLVNNSGATLHTNSTYTITLDTKTLYDANQLKDNCDDLRVYYQPSETSSTELYRHALPPSSYTCATSGTTKISFPLQADLANSGTDSNYYIYYNNSEASAYSQADALKAYNVGTKEATFVAPFNGTTTALAAGATSPTTESGAIRYSGAKSAMQFDGNNDYVTVNENGSLGTMEYTIELWLKVLNTDSTRKEILERDGNKMDFYVQGSTVYYRQWRHTVPQAVVPLSGSLTASGITANTWHHVAITRTNTNCKIFLDGILKQESTAADYTGLIGNYYLGWYNATNNAPIAIDELRLSSVTRYTSSFTPQTTPFARDEFTKLLLHFDENGDDPRNTGKAIDDSGNNNHGTITGAKYVGGLVGVDASTSDTGNIANQSYASHEGIFIEEGTTNKITNPSFEHDTYNTNWTKGGNDFTTFTPNIAKRNGGGPFAAGLLIQGDRWGDTNGDLVTFPLGSQVAGNLYSQIDRKQGTITFWYTPEFNSDSDTSIHGLFAFSSSYNGLEIYYDSRVGYKYFRFGAGNQSVTRSQTITAGTTYLITARWSSDYTLSGANYLSLSVNDSHSYGATSTPSITATTSTIRIGQGMSGGVGAADGIIEGLTIYRRPFFDGVYGINTGQGDEIWKINNGGAHTGSNNAATLADSSKSWTASSLVGGTVVNQTDGSSGTITANTGNTITASLSGGTENDWDTGDLYIVTGIGGFDPTNYTGSWDVVFCLPTNASPGSLGVGGTGNAWSHPYTSNVLYTSTSNTGGFMMNGTYTSDGWTDEGSPTNVMGTTAPEKIFAGGYQWTNDAANEGIKYAKSGLTAGQNYVVRALAHSDGTSIPKIQIWDATNGAEITQMTGSVASGRTAPDIFTFAFELPTVARYNPDDEDGEYDWVDSDCTSIEVRLLNTESSGTVYWHQVELLVNLVDNPSFEIGSGDPWTPTGWTPSNATPGKSSSCNTGNCVDITWSGAYSWVSLSRSGATTPVGSFFAEGFWYNSSYIRPHNYDHTSSANQISASYGGVTADSVLVGRVMRANSWQTTVHVRTSGSSVHFIADDYFVYNLTSVSLTVTPASSTNSVESGGIRVDGADTYTHTLPSPTTTAGTITFDYTPRHSAADVAKFGESTPYIAEFYGDSDDYIKLYWSAANTVKLEYMMIGSTANSTWDATSAISAGTTYDMEVSYTGSGNMTLKVDDATKITLSSIPAAFGTAPTTAYWGSDSLGTKQGDAVFLPQPIEPSENSTAPYYKFGSKSAKADNSKAADPRGYISSINVGNTAVHTLSAYVYDATGGNVGGTVSSDIATLVFNNVGVETTYTDMGGGWWRLSYSAATGSSSQNYGVQVKSSKTVYVDGTQLEQKGYYHGAWASTFTDGSLGTEFSWDNPESPHNSSSTRNISTLQYSASNNTNPSKGSISLWIKPKVTVFSTNTNFRLVEIGNQGSGSVTLNMTGGSGGPWEPNFNVRNNSGTNYQIRLFGQNPSAEKWYHYVGVWNENDIRFYINGISRGTPVTSATMPSAWAQDSIRLFQGLSATTFSEFTIFNDALSPTEVADLYYAGLGSHLEGTTVEQFSDGEPATSFWRLDEGSGATIYDSLSGYNGTLGSGDSAPGWSSGSNCVSNSCLSFDGTNDYAAISGNITGIKTLSFWVKPGSSSTSIFDLNGTQTVTTADGVISANNFSSPTIYVNGNQTTTLPTDTWSQVIITTETSIGASSLKFGQVSSSFFSGYLDEIRIFPYVVTPEQIKEETNLGAAALIGQEPGADQITPIKSKALVHLKFDEGHGDTANNSGTGGSAYNANLASSTSCPGASACPVWTNDGKVGKALSFDGAANPDGDYATVNLPGLIGTGTSSFSISAWINKKGNTGNSVIAAKFGFHGGLTPANGVQCMLANTLNQNFSIYYPTALNQWNHYVCTYDAQNAKLILSVNGKKYNETDFSGTVFNYSNTFYIGGNGGNYAANAIVDELKIYNSALTEEEIKQDYNQGMTLVMGAVSAGIGNTAPQNAASQEYCVPGSSDPCLAPVGEWNFEEGSGETVNDISGNNNAGTWDGTGTNHWTTGKIGKAGNFNGSDDYVAAGAGTITGTSAFTLQGWLKVDTHSNYGLAAYMGSAASGQSAWIGWTNTAQVGTSNSIGGGFYGRNYGSGITGNDWRHVALTFSGGASGTAKIYIDGIEKTTDTYTPNLQAGTVSFGKAATGTAYWYHGLVDQVRIYNYARTPAQIAWDYNRGKALVHYKFDECTGSTVHSSNDPYDSSLDGTITIGAQGTQTTVGTCSTSGTAWGNGANGKYNHSLSFDGTDDYVNIADFRINSNELTISGWAKFNNRTDELYNGLVTKQSEYVFYLPGSANNFAFYVYGATADCTTVNSYPGLQNDAWYFFTGVYNGTTQTKKIYVNGKEVASSSCNAGILDNAATNITIGGAVFGNTYWLNGQIDDVQIFNYALTKTQIEQLFNQGAAIRFGPESGT